MTLWDLDFAVPRLAKGLYLDGDNQAGGGSGGGNEDLISDDGNKEKDLIPDDGNKQPSEDKSENENEDLLEGDKPKPSEGVPEKYSFKGDDGKDLTGENIDRFVEFAKKHGLTQKQAEGMLKDITQGAADSEKQADKAFNNQLTAWRQKAQADTHPDYPIGGPKFNEAVAKMNAFVRAFGTDEFKAALKETGLQFHPEFIRAFARAGETVREDKISHDTAQKGQVNLGKLLYPNTKF